jgi:hypothetical protein
VHRYEHYLRNKYERCKDGNDEIEGRQSSRERVSDYSFASFTKNSRLAPDERNR